MKLPILTNRDIAKCFLKADPTHASYLDKDNILYRFVDGKFTGKKAVECLETRTYCWIEDVVNPNNFKNLSGSTDLSKTYEI